MGDNFRVHRIGSVPDLLGDKLHNSRQQDPGAGERKRNVETDPRDREVLGFSPLLAAERRRLNELEQEKKKKTCCPE